MKEQTKRREFIRLMALSGFGLYVTSCTGPNLKSSTIPEEIKPDSLDSKTDEIEEEFASNNVTFLSKNDLQYNELNRGFNKAIQKHPSIIALCKNTEGVSEAVKHARDEGLKVAVKSGGHSFENFSSIENGMQINLSLMNCIDWNSKAEVRIQPACLLRDVYDELLPKKRLLPAGSCGTVGIGGLTLGGGYGFFSRKYGLTCDSLMEAKFVDGLGTIHSTKGNEALMWALKGGGNGNFGIVTEFTFKTYKAPKTFTQHRFKAFNLDKERTKVLLQTYFTHSAKLPSTCFAAFVLNYKTMVLLITNYGGDNEALHDMINAFSELSDELSIGKKRNLASSLRRYYGIEYPIHFKNASAGYYDGYSSIESSIDQVLDLVFKRRGLIYQINTLGGKINDSRFESESCYPHRNMPFLAELQLYWEEGSNPKSMLVSFAEIQNTLFKNGITKQYRNYPNVEFENWESAYYGNNYEKLREIKRKYDPDDLFTHHQTVKL